MTEEKSRFRKVLAEHASRFLKGLIAPEPVEMSNHTLIIVARFKGDRSVVEDAVAKGERRAHSESSNGMMARVLFGALRLLGFGRINATGDGSVETNEVEPGLCEVKVVIGIETESHERLLAASETLNQKVGLIPARVFYKMLGVDGSKLDLVSVSLQVGNALPWTETSGEGDIREG